MKFSSLKLAVAAATLAFGAAQAAVIDFEADALGGKPNGFAAVGHPGVTFTDTAGAELSVVNFPVETAGTNGLAVFGDFDGSRLLINFAAKQANLSMSYGNDQDGFDGQPNIFALLELFDGAVLVASVLQDTNGNDLMDETIAASFAGGFDSARFSYTDGAGNLINLIEVVDNIEYNAVPEPASLALLGLGLLGLGAARRRTK